MALKNSVDAKIYALDDTRASWGPETDGVAIGPAPEDLIEIDLVKDIEIPIDKEKADVSVRRSKYKLTKGTLRGITIELPMVYDIADEGVLLLMSRYRSGEPLALAFLDGAYDEVGARGVWADFEVVSMKEGQALADAQMITFTVEPCFSDVPPEAVEVAAP